MTTLVNEGYGLHLTHWYSFRVGTAERTLLIQTPHYSEVETGLQNKKVSSSRAHRELVVDLG